MEVIFDVYAFMQLWNSAMGLQTGSKSSARSMVAASPSNGNIIDIVALRRVSVSTLQLRTNVGSSERSMRVCLERRNDKFLPSW